MPNDELTGKNLDDASLAGSDLSDADLSHTSMRRAELKGANLRGATLAGADLHGARLDGVDLTGANLHDADLTGASLHGVDLDQAATTEGIRLSGAKGLGEQVARESDDRASGAHMEEAAEDILLITRDIAQVAREVATSRAVSGQGQEVPTDTDRRAAIERIEELRVRRALVEERMMSIIEDSISDRRRPSSGASS
jgi:uncharacterized protein YjbI with pentapeptide repeats